MKYYVQFVCIREIDIDALDDSQAAQEAYLALKRPDQETVVAYKVLDEGDPGGGLKEDTKEAFDFIRQNFLPWRMDKA